MSAQKLTKWLPSLKKFRSNKRPIESNTHNIFGIEDLMRQEKAGNFTVEAVSTHQHKQAVRMIKDIYIKEHVFLRTHGLDLARDNALDEYLLGLLKQGNTVFARNDDGTPVGICVNVASVPEDPKKLRNYAFYRQDPDTKNFLNFLAMLQETPNLWELFEVPKIFEIKMLAVVPEYRRCGIATMMAESSNELAESQGIDIVRMDCINPHDFKIAERLMFHCTATLPLHGLHGSRRGCVRVYVGARSRDHPDADRRRRREERLLEVEL